MQPHPFDHLREPLLRAGISPRHVKRYLTELAEHYDDAIHDEERRGASHAEAEHAARARLGDDEHLVESALARPELRSVAARFPGLIFGAGPVLSYIALIVGITLAVANVVGIPHGPVSQSFAQAAAALCVFFDRVLPALIALAVVALAVQQRHVGRWPLIGAAIIALVGGTTDITIQFPPTIGMEGELQIESTLIPIFTDALGVVKPAPFVAGLLRAAVIFAVGTAPYFWRRRIVA